jgi:hypothetical protein
MLDEGHHAQKKRVRICAGKSLESATESGTLDAGRAAPRTLPLCVSPALHRPKAKAQRMEI